LLDFWKGLGAAQWEDRIPRKVGSKDREREKKHGKREAKIHEAK
jgi:hypothetical protein